MKLFYRVLLTFFHFIYKLTICLEAAIFGNVDYLRLSARTICLKAIFSNLVSVVFR